MLLLRRSRQSRARYAGNRHNIGFMAVDEIVRRHGFGAVAQALPGRASRRHARRRAGAGPEADDLHERIRAARSARPCASSSSSPATSSSFHDEIDLAPAKVRVKTGGGNAGHNGIRSIDAHIGNDFHRVRIGVGHPGEKDVVHSHVLGDFGKADRPGSSR